MDYYAKAVIAAEFAVVSMITSEDDDFLYLVQYHLCKEQSNNIIDTLEAAVEKPWKVALDFLNGIPPYGEPQYAVGVEKVEPIKLITQLTPFVKRTTASIIRATEYYEQQEDKGITDWLAHYDGIKIVAMVLFGDIYARKAETIISGLVCYLHEWIDCSQIPVKNDDEESNLLEAVCLILDGPPSAIARKIRAFKNRELLRQKNKLEIKERTKEYFVNVGFHHSESEQIIQRW